MDFWERKKKKQASMTVRIGPIPVSVRYESFKRNAPFVLVMMKTKS